MARDYNDWLYVASNHKRKLDTAIAEGNQKDILYYRGKYIFDLKQAYKLNNSGIIPIGSCNKTVPTNLASEINIELQNHQSHIDQCLQTNKRNSDIKKNTLTKELGLKIRRLSTRKSQVSFATGAATNIDIVKDSLGLAGTVVKAPVMVAAKVTSKVGPLAITICALPITVLASLLSFVVDVGRDKPNYGGYNDTVVHQFNDSLKDAVRSLSSKTYSSIGKI